MSKHTPGPWEWQCHDASMASLEGPGGMADHVLSVTPCEACQERAEPPEWKWGRCTTPTEANARLIAAAPDMLAALLNVRKLITEAAMTGFNCHDGDWPERLFQSQAITSDAIAKAGVTRGLEPMTEKCSACGKFIPYSQMECGGSARFHFEPDSHKGPEVSEWTCAECVKRAKEQ